MKKIHLFVGVAAIGLTAAFAAVPAAATEPSTANMPSMDGHKMDHKMADMAAIYETKNVLRDLWTGHSFWVRAVVVAHLDGDKKAEKAAEAQVVANAKMLAGSIEPFYGAAAEKALLDLLFEHYGGVKAYLVATKKGKSKGQDKAVESMLANAEKIAVFLSGANPYLPKDAVLGLYVTHETHHVAQIDALKGRDYTEEADIWMHMTQHMYVIADALTDALAKQFPEKF